MPTNSAQSIHLTVGDSLETVVQALHISGPPTPRASNSTWDIRLNDRGIWIFFDPENRAIQYRFDAPFGADIHGARIGASIDQTRAVLGDPVRDWTESLRRIYLYQPTPDMTVRCDFDLDGKLGIIMVLAGPVTFPGANSGAAADSVVYHQTSIPGVQWNGSSPSRQMPHPSPQQNAQSEAAAPKPDVDVQVRRAMDRLMKAISVPGSAGIRGVNVAIDPEALVPQLVEHLDRSNPSWNPKHPKWKLMTDMIASDVKGQTTQIDPAMRARLYGEVSSKLSAPEIEQVANYFESPNGRRYLLLEEQVDTITNTSLTLGNAEKYSDPNAFPIPGQDILEKRMHILSNGTTFRGLLYGPADPSNNVGGFGGAEFMALVLGTQVALPQGPKLDALYREFGTDLTTFDAFSKTPAARKYLGALLRAVGANSDPTLPFEAQLDARFGARWQQRYRASATP